MAVSRDAVAGFVAGGAVVLGVWALWIRSTRTREAQEVLDAPSQGKGKPIRRRVKRVRQLTVLSEDEQRECASSPRVRLPSPHMSRNLSQAGSRGQMGAGAGARTRATSSVAQPRGRVRRRQSMLSSVRPRHTAGARQINGADTLRQVIVVIRHGARLPNHPLPSDISWPESPSFFERYRGMLSPQGVLQHINLGDKLREKYVLGSHLFDGVRMMDVGSHVKVVTTNFQRTLFSAWSLLYGMFPGVPCSFKLPSERFNVDYSEIRRLYQNRELTTGVPIIVQESDMDVILRQWKRDPEYKAWKKSNLTHSAQFAAYAADPAVHRLLGKVYLMTGMEKLAPHQPLKSRLFKLTSVATQVNIARAHSLIPLANANGLLLSPTEEALLFDIAQCSWKHWFTNTTSDVVADSPGRLAAGMLLHEIWRDMDNMVHKTAPATNKVVVYSAHDSTLLAMQSRMGIRVTTTPAFAAHYVFELHETSPRKFSVRFMYNPNPTEVAEWSLRSRQQNMSDRFVSFDALPLGSTPFSHFADKFRLSAVDAIQGSKLLRNRNHVDVLRHFLFKRALPYVRHRMRQRSVLLHRQDSVRRALAGEPQLHAHGELQGELSDTSGEHTDY